MIWKQHTKNSVATESAVPGRQYIVAQCWATKRWEILVMEPDGSIWQGETSFYTKQFACRTCEVRLEKVA